MAPTIWAVFLFAFAFAFAFAFVERAQPTLSQNISFRSYLYPTRNPTSWLSPSGHFAFGFYPEGWGYYVGIWLLDGSPNKTVVWTAYIRDPLVPSNATLGLTEPGNLVLTVKGVQTILFTRELVHSASMLDNGNFVLYSSDSKIIWQSFEHPTDTILAGQSLFLPSGTRLWDSGQDLLSSSVSRTNHTIGRFRLSLDRDGLSLTPAATIDDDSSFYWRRNSENDEDFFKLRLDDNGHMYVARKNDTISLNLTDGWPSSKDTLVIYRATLDQDGIFRLYSHSMRKDNNSAAELKWQSLDEKCEVKGICGINSYCMVGEEIDCTCLPGFNYTCSSERSAGCEMRWGDPGFGSVEEKRMAPTIVTLQNTFFKGDYYSMLHTMEKEDCKEACLTDANCVAALSYSGNSCYKLKFPLGNLTS